MQQSCDVRFVSSNRDKYSEAGRILAALGIKAAHYEARLPEIQSDSLEEIAEHKARAAFELCGSPVLAEDDGLYIDCLGGFPGPYSSYVQGTIGNAGILRLVGSERGAAFRSAVAYRDAAGGAVFTGEVRGEMAAEQRGKGWGYDPVFVPEGGRSTFAEMDGKDAVSHRYRALSSFAGWFGEGGGRGAGAMSEV